jgi:hypothetical protein
MALGRLLELESEPNRYFLGCVPLAPDEHGRCGLVRKHGGRRAAVVKMRKGRNRLMSWLADDPHLAPFFDIPSKENGFDIEGLAAKGDRVWIGLRGPVLRGFAIVIELSLKTTRSGTLKARRLDGKRRYRKHAIDTAGLGIRDLCFDGTDLLVLVGTPLASDGPAHVIRWRDAAYDTVSGVVDPARLQKVCDLPYRGPVDHPEGIALVDDDQGGPRRLLVAHDSPHPDRLNRKPPRLVLDVLPID